MNSQAVPDGNMLIEIVTMQMPFGKHKGRTLKQLPISYLEWFARKGFPKNKLGNLLACLLEIKLNGLEGFLDNIEKMSRK